VSHTPAILAGSTALPLFFKFLIEQFFVNNNNNYKGISLKCTGTFSDRCGIEDSKIATQLESVLRCTAERSTISSLCDFYKDDANEEELHSKIQQFLSSSNSPTPNAVSKVSVERRTSSVLLVRQSVPSVNFIALKMISDRP